MNKYNARKVTEDGYTFDSIREYNRYCELKLLEQYCQISHLEVHSRFILQDAFFVGYKKIRAITYEPDFTYFENGDLVIEDVKGVQTEAFKMKWKMMQHNYPEYVYRIT